jgi:hypothetical protein
MTKTHRKKEFRCRRPLDRSSQRGAATLLLVSLLMMSILMAVSLANWIGVQRRGDLQMRVAIKEATLAQSALFEARLRMLDDPALQNCGGERTFRYFIDRSTITVTIDCASFP